MGHARLRAGAAGRAYGEPNGRRERRGTPKADGFGHVSKLKDDRSSHIVAPSDTFLISHTAVKSCRLPGTCFLTAHANTQATDMLGLRLLSTRTRRHSHRDGATRNTQQGKCTQVKSCKVYVAD